MPFPSDEQSAVIDHRSTPLIVVSGPGTGKTQTLVERMIKLIQEDQSREVTFITFTRTSRRDTEKKLEDAFGDLVLDFPGLMFPRTSTLHTFAKRLVHKFATLINRAPKFSILIDANGERSIVLEELSADLGLAINQDMLSNAIGQQRAGLGWPSDFPLEESAKIAIIDRFETLLRLYKTFDMEGVVLAGCEILELSDTLLPKLFLQVDEYQDLNPMDQKFINLTVSHPTSEVVIVCDDAQSIYGFRHAHPEGVRFLWESSDWEKVRFPDAFRLPSHILNAALDLISDTEYIGANINRKPPNDKRILTFQCTKPHLQVEAVAWHINKTIDMAVQNASDDISYSDFLVLCPTRNNVQQVVDSFENTHGIPAHMPVRATIPDEYWRIILLLRILENKDPLALRQWLPIQGFNPEDIKSFRDEALRSKTPLYDLCFSLTDEKIDRLRGNLDQVRAAEGDPIALVDALVSVDGIMLPSNFEEFIQSIKQEHGSIPSFGQLLHIIYSNFGIFESDEAISDEDKVLVTTMHAAKGLEAAYVYCLWMNSKFMPLKDRDLEEQRRVMYVALTRAKEDIVLAFHEEFISGRGLLRQEVMSPFLHDIYDHLKIVRIKTSDIRS
ncbi:UvrD-helicase domain-containing protein [Chloroflexota bacterium]